MLINERTAEAKNNPKAIKTSSTKTGFPTSVYHKETKNIKTPLIKAARNK